MNARSSAWRRRALLTGGGIAVAGWVLGAPRLPMLWEPSPSYRELPALSPFRELEREGAVSTAAGVLLGLDRREEPDPGGDRRLSAVRADPCQALYGTPPDDAVPVAVFSDARCRNCRALEGVISDFESAMPGAIHVVRHHLPLLGPSSITAARAALAARRQGGEEEMWHRLTGMPLVTDVAVITSAADAAGLEPDRLLAEMHGSSVNESLRNSRAIAEVFGFFGTPATAVGRTVFLGTIPARGFAQLVASGPTGAPAACRAATSEGSLDRS